MSKVYELYAPCHFGMEAVLKREIIDIGYEISRVEDGRLHNFEQQPMKNSFREQELFAGRIISLKMVNFG